jgi:hypothetical protein
LEKSNNILLVRFRKSFGCDYNIFGMIMHLTVLIFFGEAQRLAGDYVLADRFN